VLLDLLIVVVLTLHLICVNVASAGPLVCIWLDWRGGRGDALAAKVGSYLCWKSLALLLVGSALGLLLGFLHWDDAYREVIRKFPSRIFFGVWELIFSLVLIVVAGLLWRFAPKASAARWTRAMLFFLTGTNLLYHFPFLFSIISRVHSGATRPDGIVDASGFRRLMIEDSVFPQAVHFAFASFAVVGITMIGYALRLDRARRRGTQVVPVDAVRPEPREKMENAYEPADDEGDDAEIGPDSQRVAAWGARLALIATLFQIPVGMWLVVKLSPASQARVLGADPIATGLLGMSMLLSLGLLHHLSALSLGVPRKRNMVMVMAMMVTLICLMTGVLQRI